MFNVYMWYLDFKEDNEKNCNATGNDFIFKILKANEVQDSEENSFKK